MPPAAAWCAAGGQNCPSGSRPRHRNWPRRLIRNWETDRATLDTVRESLPRRSALHSPAVRKVDRSVGKSCLAQPNELFDITAGSSLYRELQKEKLAPPQYRRLVYERICQGEPPMKCTIIAIMLTVISMVGPVSAEDLFEKCYRSFEVKDPSSPYKRKLSGHDKSDDCRNKYGEWIERDFGPFDLQTNGAVTIVRHYFGCPQRRSQWEYARLRNEFAFPTRGRWFKKGGQGIAAIADHGFINCSNAPKEWKGQIVDFSKVPIFMPNIVWKSKCSKTDLCY